MDWVEQEFKSIDIGDKRLNKRATKVLKSFIGNPEQSIPSTFQSWSETKAVYRFFDNPSVTPKKLLKPHQVATLERIKAHPTVLLIEDTSSLNYSGQLARKDIGPLQQNNVRGLFIHPMLAVTPDRVCLGILSYEQWSRDELTEDAKFRKEKRRAQPIYQKESYRWLKGYKKAEYLSKSFPDKNFVYIADREGDIYEIFQQSSKSTAPNNAQWIIRSTYDRSVVDEDAKKKRNKLRAMVKASQPIGQIKFTLPADKARKPREVTQTVYAKEVTLNAPYGKEQKGHAAVRVSVVIATEDNPPLGEDPIEWVLLTSMDVNTIESALTVIQYYLCRWQIELFFKILKSGCQIEKLQLNDEHRFNPCLTMYMVVAWRVLYLTMVGRTIPDGSCELVFEPNEWKTAYAVIHKKPPPKKPPTINSALKMIAQLGGFLARKSDGEPGNKVIWKGLQALHHYIQAHEAFAAMHILN